jgi:UDP-4-amino-4,6-dideoxy-N-acetyl-beta-L-altrosamine transaminase
VPIPYGRQSLDSADVQAVVDVLEGDWLTQGPSVQAFEEALAEACDVPYAIAFSSGTAALHAGAWAAGVGPGDEVVTSAITFAASANCAAYLGATPRFAEIERGTRNVTAGTLAAAAGESTKLAVPVHFAGLAAPMEEIRAALPDSVRIMEDAAHALGARQNGEPIGSCRHSDMAVFSFHPVKAIATGEGGMVTTRDEELRDRLVEFRTHGMTKDPARLTRNDGGWYMEQQALGFNYRLSDIHSALGRSQLEKLDRFVERRNEVARRYDEELAGVAELELPARAPEGDLHAYHLYAVCHTGGADARRALYDGLRERGILAQVHYIPVYLHPWYREQYGYGEGLCPEAERYYAGALSLPCFPALTDDEQSEVIAAVRECV